MPRTYKAQAERDRIRDEQAARTRHIARELDLEIDHPHMYIAPKEYRGDRRGLTDAQLDREAETVTIRVEVDLHAESTQLRELAIELAVLLRRFGIEKL